jgi:hypothetical protein
MSNRKTLLHLRTLPSTVAALAAVGLSGPVLAQTGNPTTGATLYKQTVAIPNSAALSCENCHGAANIFKASRFPNTTEAGLLVLFNNAVSTNKGLMGAFAGWNAQMRADVVSYLAGATAAPPPPPLTLPPGTPAPAPAPAPAPTPAPAPATPTTSPTATPNPAMFSSTEVMKESATSAVLVTNSTKNTITFATPAMKPPAGVKSEFVTTKAPEGSTDCARTPSLEPGTSCSFGVRFAPLSAGTRSETWTINFSTTDVPAREVTLEGTAIGGSAATSAGTTAPTGSSAANAPSDGGGGALGLLSLFGLGGLALLGGRRRPGA